MKKKVGQRKRSRSAEEGFRKGAEHLRYQLRKAHRAAGFRAPQDGARRGRQLQGGEEQPGRKGVAGHSGGRADEPSGGHDVAGLHQQGSGGAGQGAYGLCEGESDVHVQGGHGGGARDRRQVDSRVGGAAVARRDFSESSFPDSGIGAAVGHHARRRGAKPCGGGGSGQSRKTSFHNKQI